MDFQTEGDSETEINKETQDELANVSLNSETVIIEQIEKCLDMCFTEADKRTKDFSTPVTPPNTTDQEYEVWENNLDFLKSEEFPEKALKPKGVQIARSENTQQTDLNEEFNRLDSNSEVKVPEPVTVEVVKYDECKSFVEVEKFASHFIDGIIDISIGNISPNSEREPSSSKLAKAYWPKVQDFSKEVGTFAISNYLATWEFKSEWLRCINFLLKRSDECSDYYLYEAIWSIPSKPYPIPQATASVYFTIEVSKVKPTNCAVDVTYAFESSRLIHIPGKIPFKEKWLFDIIDAKLELFKNIRF